MALLTTAMTGGVGDLARHDPGGTGGRRFLHPTPQRATPVQPHPEAGW